ncbi:MAG: ribonuclease T [Pseudomonadota bacterium]
MSSLDVANRFRGFLPVVVDIETGGFNAATDALLEIAAVFVEFDEVRGWRPGDTVARHIEPFEGANIEPSALEFNKIDPYHPFRLAVSEEKALNQIFEETDKAVKRYRCTRAILVGHNPAFDLAFLKAAVARVGLKKMPFHSFSTFDTASLSGVVFGQTVLARAAQKAGIRWDAGQAHSAIYDAERTAELFCEIVNLWDKWASSSDSRSAR